MKTLFLLRGLPSSGKTFTASILSENGKYPVLSADMYFEDSEGNYNWDPTKIKDAHTWCKEQVESVICSDENWNLWKKYYIEFPKKAKVLVNHRSKIFIANTFTQEWEMEDYFKLAEEYGYQVVSLVVENRHGNSNIHNVPDETLVKMKGRFQVKL